MVFLSQYKKYTGISSFIRYCPKRILAFKRPKWQKTQRLLSKTGTPIKLNTFSPSGVVSFNDNALVHNSEIKSWKRIKTSYAEGLAFKTSLGLYYNSALTTCFFKRFLLSRKFLTTIQLFSHTFFKPLFTVEILLWKLGFFESVAKVRQVIYSGNLQVNTRVISTNCVLAKGDVLTLVNTPSLAFCLKKKEFELFSLFFEVDYYTNSVVVLKHFTALSRSDFRSVAFDPVKLKLLIDYIKTK